MFSPLVRPRLGIFFFFLLALSLAGSLFAAERVTITVLGTTDTHGHIYPVDYYRNQPANLGLAKVSTLVGRMRTSRPNTLLIDCGDTIQGTPLAYYFNRKDTKPANPTMAVMNAMGYDAMVVGNHEFNFGLDVLWRAKREAKFPWLSANTESSYKDKARRFPPYVIKNVAGVRVAILGLTTPGIPHWELPAHYRGYRFRGLVETAKRYVPLLRRQADVVLLAVHSGLGRDPETGEMRPGAIPGEDVVWTIAEEVPGVDAIMFGHSHGELSEKFVNGVLLVQPKNWAQSVAEIDFVLERDAPGKPWRLAEKHSRVHRMDETVPADEKILALARPYHEATERYLDTPIAQCDKELEGRTARYVDHPLMDLILKVQMEYGQADVTLGAFFNPSVHLAAGPVTLRQIAALYPYENTLYTIEVTGKVLREALEHSAAYFLPWPAPEGGSIIPKNRPGYDWDMAEGVSYKVDLSRPPGQRIVDLSYRGRPLDDATKLRLAVNNYRYSGGGRYNMYRGAPVLRTSAQEVRELLIEYVSKTGRVPTEADNNWEIIPPEARAALLQEAAGPAAVTARAAAVTASPSRR